MENWRAAFLAATKPAETHAVLTAFADALASGLIADAWYPGKAGDKLARLLAGNDPPAGADYDDGADAEAVEAPSEDVMLRARVWRAASYLARLEADEDRRQCLLTEDVLGAWFGTLGAILARPVHSDGTPYYTGWYGTPFCTAPKVAPVGGYTLCVYDMWKGEQLCGCCAPAFIRGEYLCGASHLWGGDARFVIAGYQEGPTVQCPECGSDIVSDYGDPDAPDDDDDPEVDDPDDDDEPGEADAG